MAKLDDLDSDFKFMLDDLKKRESESKDNKEKLPEQLCQIFFEAEKSI